MSEEETETICISKQKIRELLELVGETKLVLKGQHIETSNRPSSR